MAVSCRGEEIEAVAAKIVAEVGKRTGGVLPG
jgi:hypothetical protein